MRIHVIYFSPTHTSRAVACAIAEGMGPSKTVVTDLTLKRPERKIVVDADVAVVAVPVYGGRVAETAMERLACLRGRDTSVVPVVIYGNRDYEDALLELTDCLKGSGFRPLAAGAFIGEHSYSRPGMPIAAGRPDEKDLAAARELGQGVRKKWQLSPRETVLTVPGHFPYKEKGNKTPVTPVTLAEKCIRCGHCGQICPTGAVSGNLPVSDAERCIKCCACVKECPAEARIFDTPYTALLFEKCQRRREPQIWW